MKRTLKIIALSAITSTLLIASDDVELDSIGINLGKAYTDHYQENHKGTIMVPHQPYKNYTGIEIFSTYNGVFEEDDLKPYLSFTYSKNKDMEHMYLLAGVNKYYYHDTLDFYAGVVGGYGQLDWNYNPINNTKDNNYDANSFLIGLQGGVEYPLNDTLSLGFNAKYLLHDYETQLEPSDDAHSTISHDKTIFLGLGLSYKFGEEKKKEPVKEEPKLIDSDNDGIYDINDICPNSAPNEIVDQNGCAKDTDSDGVVDRLDRCADTPKEASVDSNGCPIDSDNDGIYDHMDSCPNSAPNEIVDQSGCAKDTDSDGVVDRLDRCQGTPNGFNVDKDGCEVTFTIRINFPSDSAVIDDSYMDKIKELSSFLLSYPTYKALIEAHTDSKGSEGYNQELSKKRAKALYEKLIDLNIDENRIAYKGLGETTPIATNDTEEGMALNRRIEVTFIKGK